MAEEHPERSDEPEALSDEALEEELTIAASGTDEDPDREERLDDLLEERAHRSDDAGG